MRGRSRPKKDISAFGSNIPNTDVNNPASYLRLLLRRVQTLAIFQRYAGNG